MTSRAQFEMMASYNEWMNEKLYSVCADIPDEDRKKDLGAFFKSIHGTLNHLMYGDKVWMGRFIEQPLKGVNMADEFYSSFNELRQERQKMDKDIISWTQQLEQSWLDKLFTFTSGVDGKTRSITTWVLVTHMFNHQTHHRGQLTTLIKQLAYEPGITDIPFMPEFQ